MTHAPTIEVGTVVVVRRGHDRGLLARVVEVHEANDGQRDYRVEYIDRPRPAVVSWYRRSSLRHANLEPNARNA